RMHASAHHQGTIGRDMTFATAHRFFIKGRHAEIPVHGFEIAKAVTAKTMRGISHRCSKLAGGAVSKFVRDEEPLLQRRAGESMRENAGRSKGSLIPNAFLRQFAVYSEPFPQISLTSGVFAAPYTAPL